MGAKVIIRKKMKKLEESKNSMPEAQVQDGYATDVRKARRKSSEGQKGTDEFFTPDRLVEHMLDKLPDEYWTNFSKVILEPSAGNGSFVLGAMRRRLQMCTSEEDVERALKTVMSVELMEDNVREQRQRVANLIRESGYEVTDKMKRIMRKNMVCSDFFKWDFERWEPMDDGKSYELF